ncbi:MAG: hypothetical protein IPM47_10300 [Sphingobacteriales bacterium]|nr:MAG: hypothetical protein IPM47_10300 [Sphingobacteriales bacterium]
MDSIPSCKDLTKLKSGSFFTNKKAALPETKAAFFIARLKKSCNHGIYDSAFKKTRIYIPL